MIHVNAELSEVELRGVGRFAPLNEYPPNWGAISEGTKKAKYWPCQQCARALKGTDARYLHVTTATA
jgi:hypothetical protein